MNTVNKSVQKNVILPTGEEIQVATEQQQWWSENGGTGYVHPIALAPDPSQPRTHMQEEELEELRASIGAVGVRESITITPRHLTPWVKVDPEFEDCFFVIVSGHRRHGASLYNNLDAVPVVVRTYANAEAYNDDAAILNASRADLTPLEWGYVIERMLASGKKALAISKTLGKSMTWVSGRHALTRLAPDIQEKLSPKLTRHKRLATTVASALGKAETPTIAELQSLIQEGQLSDDLESVCLEHLDAEERRFHLQRILLEQAHKRRKRSAAFITKYIQDKVLTLESYRSSGAYRRPRKMRPYKKRERLDHFLDKVTQSPLMAWDEQAFEQILHNAGPKEIARLTGKLQSVIDSLQRIQTVMSKSQEEKVKKFSSVSHMLRTSYYCEESGATIKDGIIPSLERYIELYEGGLLSFQREGTTRPEELPSLEEAKAQLRAA